MASVKTFAHVASSIGALISRSTSCSSKIAQSPPLSPSQFDISAQTGFVPSLPQITRLPRQYEVWEQTLDLANCGVDSVLSLGEDISLGAIEKRSSSEAWRESIRNMPVLSTTPMDGKLRLLRRAHHVLAYLAHFYVHSIVPSASKAPIIPASIAVPLIAVSNALGLAPILTYADTVLWNIVPRDPDRKLAPGNIRVLTTFSGTEDEEAFYECCANIELYGADALTVMIAYENLNLRESTRRGTDFLRAVASELDELTTMTEDFTTILKGVYGTCSPKAFYDVIRPWFRGSSSGSLPWVYEGASEANGWKSEWATLSGPSGGQSTLMHSLDVFLDVDHAIEKLGDVRTPVEPRQGGDRLFMRRMQQYMPGSQRAFLNHIGQSAFSVRQLAVSISNSSSPAAAEVVMKYNMAVMALRKFRDAHLKVACVYVVAQARKAAEATAQLASPPTACPVGAMMARLAAEGDTDLLAVCPVSGSKIPSSPPKSSPIRGTGGTELVCLLRSCRDATSRAMIPKRPSP